MVQSPLSESLRFCYLVKRVDRLCLQQTHCSNNSNRKEHPVSRVDWSSILRKEKSWHYALMDCIRRKNANTQPSNMTNKSHNLQPKITNTSAQRARQKSRRLMFEPSFRCLVSSEDLSLLNPRDFASFHQGSARQYTKMHQERSVTVCLQSTEHTMDINLHYMAKSLRTPVCHANILWSPSSNCCTIMSGTTSYTAVVFLWNTFILVITKHRFEYVASYPVRYKKYYHHHHHYTFRVV